MMLAISLMGATAQAIFYVAAVIFFVLAGVGFKPPGDRLNLVALGLAAAFFPTMWDRIALA
jgi:hypothetical protein